MIVKVKASTWRSNSWDVLVIQGRASFIILEGSTKERAEEVAKKFAAALSDHNADVVVTYEEYLSKCEAERQSE